MDTLIFSLNAVLPILILIGFGYFLKRVKFLDEHFLQIGNKFVFRVALPTLLFYTIYKIETISDINWPVIVYAVIGVLLLFVIGLIIAIVFIKDDHQRGTLIQATFRANYAIIKGFVKIFLIVVRKGCTSSFSPLTNIVRAITANMFIKGTTKAEIKATTPTAS